MEQLILGIGIVAVCFLAICAPRIFKAKDPVCSKAAQVISRKGNMPDGSYSNFRGSKMQYTVTFLVEDKTLELQVTSSQYIRLVEGMCWQITWQGDTLVAFEPIQSK